MTKLYNHIISCRQLTKSYKRGANTVLPLEMLNLDVKEGEFLVLMGPSGSGKTTLLNLIAGIDSPSKGELLINGQDISKLSRGKLTKWRFKNVGYIFQLYHLVPILTAYENIELPMLLKRLSRRERHAKVMLALDLVGLHGREDHYPRQLSGGQEQRVAIARALVNDPPLLVADEPTGDLDKESAIRIMDLLKQLSNELNKTVVMVTHDTKAQAWADRVLHLDKGTLLEKAEHEEI